MGTFLLLLFIVLLVALFSAIFSKDFKRKRLADTEEAYRASLVQLSQDPTSPVLKQKALALGRVYSVLTRNQRRVATYTEAALIKDVGVACAEFELAANDPQAIATLGPHERLVALIDLRNRELISDEAFQEEQDRLRGELQR